MVDFPEPDGPIMLANSPLLMSSDTFRMACTLTESILYIFEPSSSLIISIDRLRPARYLRWCPRRDLNPGHELFPDYLGSSHPLAKKFTARLRVLDRIGF